MEEKPVVLIIGAGAMGLITGYLLSLAGAEITFFVRPARVALLQQAQKFYCITDRSLKTFSDFKVISSVAEMAPAGPDYVISTLDGDSMLNEQGSALLADIGKAILRSKTIFIFGGVGIGLREHVLKQTGLPPERVLSASQRLISYQLPEGSGVLINPPAPPDLISQAVLAYAIPSNSQGFVIENRYPAEAKKFVALYDRSMVSKCMVVNAALMPPFINMFFPLVAVSELTNWPSYPELKKNKALWQLNCQAAREIMGIKQFGWVGKLLRLVMRDSLQYKLWNSVAESFDPMDFQSFNKFHHGGKVLAQDIGVLDRCLSVGLSNGQSMPALKELIARFKTAKPTNFGSL